MKVFNAIQIVAFTAAGPFVVGWLARNPFPFSRGLMAAAVALYVVGLAVQVAATRELMD